MDGLLVLVPVSNQATCEYFSYLQVHRLLAGYCTISTNSSPIVTCDEKIKFVSMSDWLGRCDKWANFGAASRCNQKFHQN